MAKAHPTTTTLTIDLRTESGTTSARAVRRAGNMPGVLYGHGDPTPISIAGKAFEELLTTGGKSHVLDATIGGKPDSVLLRDVQRDPVNHRPIHADFQRVNKNEEITTSVPIVLVGESLAVKNDGAMLDTVTREAELKGPAGKIPDQLTIDVSKLTLHTKVTAGDLVIPAGFTLLTPAETVMVTIEPSKTAVLAEEAAATQAEESAAAAAGDVSAPAEPVPATEGASETN
jgi:large subunit ribosomal protein L25